MNVQLSEVREEIKDNNLSLFYPVFIEEGLELFPEDLGHQEQFFFKTEKEAEKWALEFLAEVNKNNKVKFSEENITPDKSSEMVDRLLKKALKENLVLASVSVPGSCSGCFFDRNFGYFICHRLDCNGENHIFRKDSTEN